MAKGGYRQGAGRPRGAHTGSGKRPRRLTPSTGPSPAELKEARDRARVWLQQNEPALIDEFMGSNDPRLKLEVWKVLKTYGDGPPKHHLEVTHRKSPEMILDEIALRAFSVEVIPEPRQIEAGTCESDGEASEGDREVAASSRAPVQSSDSLSTAAIDTTATSTAETKRLEPPEDASAGHPGARSVDPVGAQIQSELAEWDAAHGGKL